jgi:hypothetical protein
MRRAYPSLESDINRDKYKQELNKQEYNVARFMNKFKQYANKDLDKNR